MAIYSMDFSTGKLIEKKDIQLEIGQIIWLNGYGQDKYYHDRRAIYDSYLSEYDKRLMYKYVNLDTFETGIQEAHSITPVDKMRGQTIGIYYTPGDMATPEEIKTALEKAPIVAKEKGEAAKRKAEEQAKADKAEREKFNRDFPYLEKLENSKKSYWALGAANIKRELNRAFPGHKFTVKSESYSMGDSINIYWTDGPATDEVKKITDKYQKCDFDGMQDLEIYLDRQFPEIYGGAKYVFENRTVSVEKCLEVAKELGIKGAKADQYNNVVGIGFDNEKRLYQETKKRSYYVKPEKAEDSPVKPITGKAEVRRNEEKNGVEIHFSEKPGDEILTELKSNGWRWSRFTKCWYKRFTEFDFNFANAVVELCK